MTESLISPNGNIVITYTRDGDVKIGAPQISEDQFTTEKQRAQRFLEWVIWVNLTSMAVNQILKLRSQYPQ
jgi:uncharacterized membrane protein (DUF106 family)